MGALCPGLVRIVRQSRTRQNLETLRIPATNHGDRRRVLTGPVHPDANPQQKTPGSLRNLCAPHTMAQGTRAIPHGQNAKQADDPCGNGEDSGISHDLPTCGYHLNRSRPGRHGSPQRSGVSPGTRSRLQGETGWSRGHTGR